MKTETTQINLTELEQIAVNSFKGCDTYEDNDGNHMEICHGEEFDSRIPSTKLRGVLASLIKKDIVEHIEFPGCMTYALRFEHRDLVSNR